MIRALLAAAALLGAGPAAAEGTPGAFDFYVLALSWSPGWCAREGDERGSPQCARPLDDGPLGWTLHGLWPQYEEGWPSDCASDVAGPTRAEAEAMADIMGDAGLALHEWRRHGTCSGLSPEDYFALSREAFEAAAIPGVFARLPRAVEIPAAVVEEAFLREDPGLDAAGVVVTCAEGRIAEVRLCLTRDLAPRACGGEVGRECRLADALMDPVE